MDLKPSRSGDDLGAAGRPACTRTYVQLRKPHPLSSLLHRDGKLSLYPSMREHQRVDEAAITRLRSEALGSPNSSW